MPPVSVVGVGNGRSWPDLLTPCREELRSTSHCLRFGLRLQEEPSTPPFAREPVGYGKNGHFLKYFKWLQYNKLHRPLEANALD